MKNIYIQTAAIFSAILGLLTVFIGGSVIFDLFGMRAEHGNYVLFVVWANFICAFLYLIASYGFFMKKKWTASVLMVAVLILILAFIGFAVWVFNGNLYEKRTIGAMAFRLAVTIGLFLFARSMIRKVPSVNP